MKKHSGKKFFSCILAVSIIITSITISPESRKASAVTDTWTLAVYMCGADLESAWGGLQQAI